MVDNDYISYCGVDCSLCGDFKVYMCRGCKMTDWKEGDTCFPVECCRKQKINFCGECPTFPCDDINEFYKESENHKQAYERMLNMSKEK